MRIILGTALLLATATALAQRVPVGIPLPGLGAGGQAPSEQDVQNYFAEAGKRDGDENLTCEQLQTELTAIQESPELQAMSAQADSGADQAQQLLESLQGQQPSIAGMIGRGLVQSVNPFAGIGARRRGARQQAEMEAKLGDITRAFQPGASPADVASSPFGALAAGMPVLMRMNRVQDLGRQKMCDWAADLPPPLTEPTREER